jgi:competence protein ComEC
LNLKPRLGLLGDSGGNMGNSAGAIVLCIAYILGLLSTAFLYGGFAVLFVGVGLSLILPRLWRKIPQAKIWLLAGLIGLLASGYFQWRLPQPTAKDVSQLAAKSSATVELQGQVESLPRVTRSQKAQFWLTVQPKQSGSKDADRAQSLTGKVYVTVPLLQATGLHPGQWVRIAGLLYQPQPASNPGAFDFREFLRQEGCFAGLSGDRVEIVKASTGWGWWQVQQQIVRSQIRWLGSPVGPLVSAMVLGSKGVDLPADLKDQFTQAGLAHALAASGFQTSLILGVVLALTRRLSKRVQFLAGTISLAVFVGLTGLQPAVLRAAIMGFGSLIALLMNRKVKPLGTLLVTAVLLLLWNPLWIWNLGFQLSFLATIGLLITVPPLTQRLDWLPSAIAPLVAVPIAAYVWTLPLQLFAFGTLSPYSIPVNLITTPLISILSLGGMASALAALIWSPAGSAIAWLLQYPTQALLAIVAGCAQLPGSGYAVGAIPVGLAIGLYALIGVTWLQPWWQKRWWVALLLGVSLVLIPAWQAQANLFRVTLLATSGQPVMVLEDGGRTTLINSGDAATVNFAVLPFLQKAGVNQVNWAITLDRSADRSSWQLIRDRLPIKSHFFLETAGPERSKPLQPAGALPIAAGQTLPLGSLQLTLRQTEPPIVEFHHAHQRWLWLGDSATQQADSLKEMAPVQVLWWSGEPLRADLLAALRPEVAIASTKTLPQATIDQFQPLGTRLYWTGQHGAIQWTPQTGFKPTLNSSENQPSAL